MQFGELIEYKMRTIFFFEKSCSKSDAESIPRPFSKLTIFLKIFMQLVFIACQVEGYQIILKWSCRPLAFISYKHFLKTKGCLELLSLPHFLHDFWRKIFLQLYSINWSDFIVCLPLLREILGNMYIAIVC